MDQVLTKNSDLFYGEILASFQVIKRYLLTGNKQRATCRHNKLPSNYQSLILIVQTFARV